MTLRLAAAAAALTLVSAPAWADCAQDIEALDQAIVAAETGDAPAESGMPATEHQQEVLSEEPQGAQGDAPMETAAGPTGDVEAASPHQRQVTREISDDERAEASALVEEARQLAEAGDEQACQAKLAEAEALLGMQ